MYLTDDPRQRTLAQILFSLRHQSQGELFAPFALERLPRMEKLAAGPDRALSRDNFEPGHFTASAFVLSPSCDSLLLVHHKKLGMWLQPGGHIEVIDEDPLSAALREVREETGLVELEVKSVVFDLDIHEIPAWGTTPAHEHFDIRSLFLAKSTEVVASTELHEARWFELAEIYSSQSMLLNGHATDQSVRRIARFLEEEMSDSGA